MNDSKEKELLTKLINHALKLLGKRMYSHEQLRQTLARYLYKKRVENAEVYIQETLSFLDRKKFLNDTAYSESFVRDRQLLKPRSKKMLSLELRRKGISENEIETVLQNYDEDEAMRKLIKKKSRYSPQELTQYLLRQGFPYDLVKKSVK